MPMRGGPRREWPPHGRWQGRSWEGRSWEGRSWDGGPWERGSWERGPWPGGRRLFRVLFGAMFVFLVVPLAAGVLFAATFAGWTSVAVAVVFWIALIVVAVIAVRLAFRNFRPIQELVSSTGRLAEGDYSARVASTDSPAMRPLVASFNQMAERLEISDELRRRLLADVGHELRTPLTIVRGHLEAMADGVRELDEEEIRRLLADVATMERLLDDLRTLSTTEAGMVELDLEPVDLAEVVEDLEGRFAHQAEELGVEVVTRIEAGSVAVADPYRISQVGTNLVVNALRAVSAGDRIELSARPGNLDDDTPAAVLEIRDSGTGIEPDRLDAVFDRFNKGVDSSGSGLGLTISRDLVHAHHGSIDISSELGVGTTVTVRLPAEPGA